MSSFYQPPSVESIVETRAALPLDIEPPAASGLAALEPAAEPGLQDPRQGQDCDNTGQAKITVPSQNLVSSPATPPATSRPFRPVGQPMPGDNHRALPHVYRPPSPSDVSTVTNSSSSTSTTHMSDGSNGSASTLTRRGPHPRRGDGERLRDPDDLDGAQDSRDAETTPKPHQAPYFGSNSGETFNDNSRRSVDQPHPWRMGPILNHKGPTSRSVSSGESSHHSDLFSETSQGRNNEGTVSSPDRSELAGSPSTRFSTQGPYSSVTAPPQHQKDPFMYMVPAAAPYLGPHGQLPLGSSSQQPPSAFYEHFQQTARPEQLSLTGYELLATKLSVGGAGGHTITPMYRRFEALNHRLLLHLQDELTELEEQLHQLDAVDTQNRRTHHGCHPASRRQETLAAGDLHWMKTDVLGKIGYKLGQYNQVLTSFKKTQDLPSPEGSDIDTYRAYLINHRPVAENESQFLDIEDDLVSMCRPGHTAANNGFENDELLMVVPHKPNAFPLTPTSPLSEIGSRSSAQRFRARPNMRKPEATPSSSIVPMLAASFAAAFLLPILSFIVIPALAGRVAVVFLMTVATAVALIQTGITRQSGASDASSMGPASNAVMCAGVYGAVMAVVATIV